MCSLQRKTCVIKTTENGNTQDAGPSLINIFHPNDVIDGFERKGERKGKASIVVVSLKEL